MAAQPKDKEIVSYRFLPLSTVSDTYFSLCPVLISIFQIDVCIDLEKVLCSTSSSVGSLLSVHEKIYYYKTTRVSTAIFIPNTLALRALTR